MAYNLQDTIFVRKNISHTVNVIIIMYYIIIQSIAPDTDPSVFMSVLAAYLIYQYILTYNT